MNKIQLEHNHCDLSCTSNHGNVCDYNPMLLHCIANYQFLNINNDKDTS